MRKLLLSAAILGFSSFAFAQDEQPPVPPPPAPSIQRDGKSDEIIIRSKGDKDVSLNVEMHNDSVYINGKPLSDFIDSNVTIKKRKIIIRNGDQSMIFDMNNEKRSQELAEKYGKQWQDWGENFGRDWQRNFEISRPFLGVTTEDAEHGVKIVEIVPKSAAEKAGLKEGDIITKINDEDIDNPEKLSDVVASFKPKEEVTVNYIRNGKKNSSKAILGEHKDKKSFAYVMPDMPERPEQPEMPEQPERPEMPEINFDNQSWNNGDFGMMKQPKLGLKIQDTDDGTVKIVNVEDSSNAAKAGLMTGDIITEIDGEKISNTDEARDHLHPEEGKKSYNIKVNRNGTEMSFDVKVPRRLKTADL